MSNEVHMEGKKVKILLSAYNGEKYIAQQIDSILGQSWKNIEIYVRDDGSSDHTVEVVEEYEKQGLVHLERGKNLGFIKSFWRLVENCGDADYFAFADQDDEWFPEKISMAVECLTRVEEDCPALYFSNYDFYDGELNFVAHQKGEEKRPSFCNALVDCIPLGFNSVFNRKARELMCAHIPKYSCGHDWWTYLVCQGMGKVIYDPRPTVKYRRHNKSVSPGGMSFFKLQAWRFRKFFLGDYFANVIQMLEEYEKYYGKHLAKEDRYVLRLFTAKDHRVRRGIRKFLYPKRFRQSWIDELMIRLVFLTGRL